MIIKHFKLSQPEKERLIRIKAKTGVQNWNILCRWALCWSLSEPTIPGSIDPQSDSNVEMDWTTFAGEYAEIYEAIIRQRCLNDGINHYSTRDVLKSCSDLLESALPKEEA